MQKRFCRSTHDPVTKRRMPICSPHWFTRVDIWAWQHCAKLQNGVEGSTPWTACKWMELRYARSVFAFTPGLQNGRRLTGMDRDTGTLFGSVSPHNSPFPPEPFPIATAAAANCAAAANTAVNDTSHCRARRSSSLVDMASSGVIRTTSQLRDAMSSLAMMVQGGPNQDSFGGNKLGNLSRINSAYSVAALAVQVRGETAYPTQSSTNIDEPRHTKGGVCVRGCC